MAQRQGPGTVGNVQDRVLRVFFDRGVAFVPAGGRVLLAFDGEPVPLDITDDLGVVLEAGLSLLEEPPAASSSSQMVTVGSVDVPDRMRVYHDGLRVPNEVVGAAIEATVRAAVRAAVIDPDDVAGSGGSRPAAG